MIMIKIYNRKTNEMLQLNFDSEEEARLYETILEFTGAEYEYWLNGYQLY